MEDSGISSLAESSNPNHEQDSVIGDVITEKMALEEAKLEEKAIKEENNIKKEMLETESKELEEQCYKRLNLLLSRSSIYAQFMAEKLKRDELKEARRQARAEKKSIAEPQAGESTTNSGKRKSEMQCSSKKKQRGALTVVDVFKKENIACEDNKQNIKIKDITDSNLPQNDLLDDDVIIDEDIIDSNLTQNGVSDSVFDKNEGIDSNLTQDDEVIAKQPALLTGGIMHPYQIEGYEWLKVLFENGVNGILADEMGLGKTIQSIAFIAYLIEMGVSGPYFVCGPLSTVPNWYAEFKRFTPTIPAMIYHGDKAERKVLQRKIAKKVKVGNTLCCPVVLTSYAIALNDAKILAKYDWKLLVIDEAHRIKNFQCKLVAALKLFNASHRLLLTGTPLQNNLAELWSLLNFILPEIFDDLKVFESWFDISRISKKGGTKDIVAKEQEKQIISIIHQILTPFLLRRTKAEVKLELPLKKEVIVHAPLTKLQQKYYTAALNKTIKDLVGESRGHYFDIDPIDMNSGRAKRNTGHIDFSEIYKTLNSTSFNEDDIPVEVMKMPISTKVSTPDASDLFSEIKLNTRNVCMLLRKICGHPYLISYPIAADGGYKIDDELIKNSGKLLVLDQILPELKKRGHKILLFSQFVTMLEILQDYCGYRNYSFNLLHGSMNLEERDQEMKKFKESPDAFIFLISTKAGGLGINLATADTVIIYDSDWNPQGDLQAQDRCHRIGQTKPVVVYRLIIPNTVDENILDRATAKRKLEKVIIKTGRFSSRDTKKVYDKLSIEELIELLQASDFNGFVKTNDNNVLSLEEIEKILDRSDLCNT